MQSCDRRARTKVDDTPAGIALLIPNSNNNLLVFPKIETLPDTLRMRSSFLQVTLTLPSTQDTTYIGIRFAFMLTIRSLILITKLLRSKILPLRASHNSSVGKSHTISLTA